LQGVSTGGRNFATGSFELRKQLRARMRGIAVYGEAQFPPDDD
jgi:hypothetical protein